MQASDFIHTVTQAITLPQPKFIYVSLCFDKEKWLKLKLTKALNQQGCVIRVVFTN